MNGNGGGITVRKTIPEDRSALAAMIEGSENLSSEEMDCAAELLDIYFENPLETDYLFITALDPSSFPAGYACYGKRPLTDAVYDLYWIIVDRQRRRGGVGTRLIEEIETLLAREGARMLVAETSGLHAYEAARRLYLGNGFCEEARISEFYKPGDDMVFYIKRLQKINGDA